MPRRSVTVKETHAPHKLCEGNCGVTVKLCPCSVRERRSGVDDSHPRARERSPETHATRDRALAHLRSPPAAGPLAPLGVSINLPPGHKRAGPTATRYISPPDASRARGHWHRSSDG